MKLLGGTWISNVGLSIDQTELRQLDSTHPVCRGWKGYQLRDEFYLNPQIGPEAKPLLEVTTKDQKVVVGWAFERPDGGRSYATTLGHYYDNFQRDDFRKAIVNAILWTAKRDVPPDGAPIDLSADALKLPPK
jgi:type 1 glutamine amidotransferase